MTLRQRPGGHWNYGVPLVLSIHGGGSGKDLFANNCRAADQPIVGELDSGQVVILDCEAGDFAGSDSRRRMTMVSRCATTTLRGACTFVPLEPVPNPCPSSRVPVVTHGHLR